MTLSSRTIALLAQPFEGGAGPSHSTIELIWQSADAAEYLPPEGNKLDRVLRGLGALRDGRPRGPGQRSLPRDKEKLQSVANALATRLIAGGLLDADSVSDALAESESTPSRRKRKTPSPRTSGSAGHPSRSALVAETVAVSDPSVVMVVHGQDAKAANAMFDWLRAIGLRPQEWDQLVRASASASPFIGEVLDSAFRTAQAVVVLFTPDEHVRLREQLSSEQPRWRLQSRPNVLFEAGMALASHPRRTALVVLGAQELPSDLAGRHYVRLGSPQSLRDLAHRLEQAGCPVDLSGSQWLDTSRFPDRSQERPTPASGAGSSRR